MAQAACEVLSNLALTTHGDFNMLNLIKSFWNEEEGAAAIEYALIAALIAIAIVGGATVLGGGMDTMFNDLGTYVSGLAASLP